jgi:HK97 family phage portal protein
MGITSRRVSVQRREVSISPGLMASLRSGGTAGQTVTRRTAIRVPTVGAAVAFRASHVAMLDIGTYRDDGDAIPAKVTDSWQSRLLKGVPNPNQSWYEFWEIVESSLSYRGNAYVWKTRGNDGKVVALTALHPDQVFPYNCNLENGRLRYPVAFMPLYPCPPDVEYQGSGSLTVDKSVIWHVRGRGGMGETVAPSPIERYAQSIGAALAKQDYEASLYENGVLGGTVVSFPATMTRSKAEEWKKLWNDDNAGTNNAGRTKVIGGGATVSQIGMTQRDAQFIESVDLSVIDVANIFGVPAYFLNQNERAAKIVLPEHEEARWVNHYLAPELRRIEQSLYADTDIFGPGSKVYPRFDSAGLIHPDSATKAGILATKVQTGQWTPDEARSADGMPPLPDGIGKVPIFVPVGGTPFGMPATTNQDTEEDA